MVLGSLLWKEQISVRHDGRIRLLVWWFNTSFLGQSQQQQVWYWLPGVPWWQVYVDDEAPNEYQLSVTDSNQPLGGGDGFYSVYSFSDSDSSSSSSSTTTTGDSSATKTQAAAESVSTQPGGHTVIVTAAAKSTSTGDDNSKGGGTNTAAIAAGVVVGVVGVAALAGGGFFFYRSRKQKAEGGAGTSFSRDTHQQMSDSRFDGSYMAQRRQSNGSIDDDHDFSRRILQVTNPDHR